MLFSSIKNIKKKKTEVVRCITPATASIMNNMQEPQDGRGTTGELDLIICDEAHRTTGYAESEDKKTVFTKVHNNDFIRAKKRIYMTATPRIYTAQAKNKVREQI